MQPQGALYLLLFTSEPYKMQIVQSKFAAVESCFTAISVSIQLKDNGFVHLQYFIKYKVY